MPQAGGVVCLDIEAGHSVTKEPVAAVPGQVLVRRPVGGIGRQGEGPVAHAGQQMGSLTRFREMSFGDENRVVVAQGPEAVVEQPVGVLAQGDAVVQGIVAAGGELVDVAGVDDGAGVKRSLPRPIAWAYVFASGN